MHLSVPTQTTPGLDGVSAALLVISSPPLERKRKKSHLSPMGLDSSPLAYCQAVSFHCCRGRSVQSIALGSTETYELMQQTSVCLPELSFPLAESSSVLGFFTPHEKMIGAMLQSRDAA